MKNLTIALSIAAAVPCAEVKAQLTDLTRKCWMTSPRSDLNSIFKSHKL